MASSSREAGINRAATLGSVLPQRTFRVAMVLSPLRRAWEMHRGLGAEHPHACRLVFIWPATCGLALGTSHDIAVG